MKLARPKYIENKEWYYEDLTHPLYKDYEMMCHRLTDKAPKEAVLSYLRFNVTLFDYSLGYVPEFVYEEYRKHIARFEEK